MFFGLKAGEARRHGSRINPIRRCAIYARKSSEERLEQHFHSLQAQREACEAFVQSQVGEGRRPVKTHYDDGGLSGGSMERPALRQLLADIKQGALRNEIWGVETPNEQLGDRADGIESYLR